MQTCEARKFVGQYVVSPDLRGIWLIDGIWGNFARGYLIPDYKSGSLYLPDITKIVVIQPSHRIMLLDFVEGKNGAIYFPRRRKARNRRYDR